jgi:SAM-dependent methyltransferase
MNAGGRMPSRCRICGSQRGTPVVLRELLYGTGEQFDYWLCQDCGCYQIVTIPEDMGRYYPPDYYSFARFRLGFHRTCRLMAAGVGNRLGLDLLRKDEPLRPILSFLPRSGGRVVDIGAGNARVIRQLSLLSHKCTAVDPYANPRGLRSGVRYLKCEADQVKGDFDLVMLFDSLEHMADPHRIMAAVSRLVRPDGVAILRIPVVPNNVFDAYGDSWLGLDPPRHFYTFTLKALELLAREHGLAVRKVSYDAQSWSLAAARACQEDKARSGPLSPDRFRGTEEDEQQTRRANQERRGDTVYMLLVHPPAT